MTAPAPELTATRIWQQLAALSQIYGTAAAASAPWCVTVEPWTLTAHPHLAPVFIVHYRDWIAGEIGADYVEVFVPGVADAAGQLRSDLAEHVYQFNRARRPTS